MNGHAVHAVAMVVMLASGPASAQVSAAARQIHDRALVFDAHVHMGNRQFYGGGDMGQRLSKGQVDLPRLKEGGVDAIFFSLWVREEYYPGRFETKQVLRLLDAARAQIDKNADKIEVALTATDVERIVKAGKIAAVLDLEGGFDLDGDLAVLRSLYRLGLRSAQLTAHNWANNFADSCCNEHKWNGLNSRGREVVREMNRLGMVINVSHASDETLAQTIELSSDPVVATHHGLRSVNDIPRTMTDDLLKKLAAHGGLMGFHIGNEFQNRKFFDYRTRSQGGKPFWDTSDVFKKVNGLSIERIDDLLRPRRGETTDDLAGVKGGDNLLMSVDDWVGVVDRAITLVGEDHVTLGSDWDSGPTPPRGMRDVRDVPLITEAMLKRGYSETRIRKFLGGNLLRVFRQVTEKKRADR